MKNPGAKVKFVVLRDDYEYMWTKTFYGNVEDKVAEYKDSKEFKLAMNKLGKKHNLFNLKVDEITYAIVGWVKRPSRYDRD